MKIIPRDAIWKYES
ncbi:hypothetical protein [Dehalobacter sp. DCM]